MDKKRRARVLMDQKATSVADVAAVLFMQEEGLGRGEGTRKEKKVSNKQMKRRARHKRLEELRDKTRTKQAELVQQKMEALKRRDLERRRRRAENQAIKQLKEEIDERKRLGEDYEDLHEQKQALKLEKLTRRIANAQARGLNPGFLVRQRKNITGEDTIDESLIEEQRQLLSEEAEEIKDTVTKELKGERAEGDSVKILWANLYDAQYAEKWPLGVIHGELEQRKHVFGFQKRFEEPEAEPEPESAAQEVEQVGTSPRIEAPPQGLLRRIKGKIFG